MKAFTPLPDWAGTVKKVFLLYMFPFAPAFTDIQKAFGGIFTAFSNLPREYFIVVYDATNLPDMVIPAGNGYLNEVKITFVQSQSQTVFEYYKKKLAELRSPTDMQPSSFLRNSYFGQDPAKFAIWEGQPVMVFPGFPVGSNPTYVQAAQAIASAAVIPAQFLRIYFEGGNILQGDGFVLAGKNILMGTDLEQNPYPNVDANAELRKCYNSIQVVFLGADVPLNNSPSFWQQAYQPSFHIDNLVTLLGPMTDPVSGTKKMAILLAEFVSSAPLSGASAVLFDQMADAMNQIENQLTSVTLGGLEVSIIKIPSLLIPNVSSPYVLSWNNCIVETTDTSRRVYLPVYSSPDTTLQQYITQFSASIQSQLDGWGIETIWVDNNLTFYSQNYHGSLHCMFCAIERS